jgi:hypothetical protein
MLKKIPPYQPNLQRDDLVRFMVLSRQAEPLAERVDIRAKSLVSYEQQFGNDAVAMAESRMSPHALMEKRRLADIFSNKVYRVVDGCTFHIVYPVPEMEVTYRMKVVPRRNDEKRITHMQTTSGLIQLTAREVSEIVFIAHLQDGQDGIAKYAGVAEGDPFLLPMDRPVFQTELGRRLHAAITGNPDEKDRPHEEEHGHHHPEMSEAERLAWQPPPNTNSNGNVWSYLMPDKTVKTIEFFTDSEVRVSTNGRVSEFFQWFKKDGAVTANGSRWFTSPDGQTILEESRHRTWHRGRRPPAPAGGVAEALTAEGTRWVAEDGKTTYVFRPDGTCVEEERPRTPKATWEPWYGRTLCIRHTKNMIFLVVHDLKNFRFCYYPYHMKAQRPQRE